jgi:hypothetical protein
MMWRRPSGGESVTMYGNTGRCVGSPWESRRATFTGAMECV